MGYACPVCETPQADARHLANHLAFTAMVRGGDHEEWLDEHLPEWAEAGEAELAEHVTEFAAEEDYPQVFEDTVNPAGEHQHDDERSGKLFEEGASHGREGAGHGHESAHDHGRGEDAIPHEMNQPPQRPRDDETEAIYEEARELTEAMLADDDDPSTEGEESTDSEAE